MQNLSGVTFSVQTSLRGDGFPRNTLKPNSILVKQLLNLRRLSGLFRVFWLGKCCGLSNRPLGRASSISITSGFDSASCDFQLRFSRACRKVFVGGGWVNSKPSEPFQSDRAHNLEIVLIMLSTLLYRLLPRISLQQLSSQLCRAYSGDRNLFLYFIFRILCIHRRFSTLNTNVRWGFYGLKLLPYCLCL